MKLGSSAAKLLTILEENQKVLFSFLSAPAKQYLQDNPIEAYFDNIEDRKCLGTVIGIYPYVNKGLRAIKETPGGSFHRFCETFYYQCALADLLADVVDKRKMIASFIVPGGHKLSHLLADASHPVVDIPGASMLVVAANRIAFLVGIPSDGIHGIFICGRNTTCIRESCGAVSIGQDGRTLSTATYRMLDTLSFYVYVWTQSVCTLDMFTAFSEADVQATEVFSADMFLSRPVKSLPLRKPKKKDSVYSIPADTEPTKDNEIVITKEEPGVERKEEPHREEPKTSVMDALKEAAETTIYSDPQCQLSEEDLTVLRALIELGDNTPGFRVMFQTAKTRLYKLFPGL